jgi:hypothetical protein
MTTFAADDRRPTGTPLLTLDVRRRPPPAADDAGTDASRPRVTGAAAAGIVPQAI